MKARALLDRILVDVDGAVADRVTEVVRWRWATVKATVHIPEPLFKLRQHQGRRTADRWFDERPPRVHGRPDLEATEYGFDRNDRIVVVRGVLEGCGIPNVHGEGLVWYAEDGSIEYAANLGRQESYCDVVSYSYDGGHLTRSLREMRFKMGRRTSWQSCSTWFVYESPERLTRVLSSTTSPDSDEPYLRSQRISWSPDGEPARVDAMSGSGRFGALAHADPTAPNRAGRAAFDTVAEWDRTAASEMERYYDARFERVETELPPLREVYEELEPRLLRATRAAISEAVETGVVERPFLISLSWALATPAGLPPVLSLVGDAARVRRKELPEPPPDYFPEELRLSLADHLDEQAQRCIRQIRQTPYLQPDGSRPSPVPYSARFGTPTPSAPLVRVLTDELLVAIADDLNTSPPAGAAGDCLTLALENWDLIARAAGAERVATFRASLQRSTPLKLPRGPGRLQNAADVEKLLRSRGIREALIRPLIDSAATGIRLIPAADDAVRTRSGGHALLPRDLEWPISDGRPLDLLAQVDLSELPAVPDRELLPETGRLLFFYLIDEDDGWFESVAAGPDDEARVIYLADDTAAVERQPPPPAKCRAATRLIGIPRLTLPATPRSLDGEELDYYDQLAYDKAYQRSEEMKDPSGTHRHQEQILGHPSTTQPGGPWYPDHEPARTVALLNLSHRTFADLDLGDGGSLTYLINPDALRRRDWSSVWVDAQSS